MAITTLLNHLVFILLLSAPAIYADVYIVGDTSGWTLNYDYTTWAAGKNFKIGDTLVFNYFPNHKLDIVNEADYGSCTVGNPIKTYSGVAATINLTEAGSIYFICPVSSHCSQGGMKLAINVAPLTTTPPTTTPPAESPTPPDVKTPPTTTPPLGSPSPPDVKTPPTTITPPGSPSPPDVKTASPPPPPSGVDGCFSSFWMLGVSLVAAIAVLGFMG